MSLSMIQKAAMLDTLDGRFVALHSADPGETGAGEIAGGSYARQPAGLSPTLKGEKSNRADAITFLNLPAAIVTHFAVWSSAQGGAFLWGGALNASVRIDVWDSFQFGPAALTFLVT